MGHIRSRSYRRLSTLPSSSRTHLGHVLEHHALHGLAAVGTRGLARQNHLSIFEFAGKIQVAAFVVHPGLLPFARSYVKDGSALAPQMHGIAAGEIFLDDAAIQNSPDTVGPVSRLARIISRPGKVPFANPEFELLLLRLGAGAGLCRGIVLPCPPRKSRPGRAMPADSFARSASSLLRVPAIRRR